MKPKDKYDNFSKGAKMDFRYYDKITPSDKARFDMLFHSAQRTDMRQPACTNYVGEYVNYT